MTGPSVRSIALLMSDREKGEKFMQFLTRRSTNVEILGRDSISAPGPAECVIAEAASLGPGDVRALLDIPLALIVLGNPGKNRGEIQTSPLVRIMPARSSPASAYAAALQTCAARDAILASRTVVGALHTQLRTLLSSVPDIVYILDERGNFVYLNESVTLLGYEPAELVGRHFSIIIHPEDKPNISRDIVVEKIRRANKFPDTPPKLFDERRSGQRMTRDLEVRLVHKDGHIVYALVNAYGERNLDMPLLSDVVGQNPQTIGVVHDVSAMHFYQQSLEDSLTAKEQLLREIHHRVKTNLQLVASLVHLQQTDDAPSYDAPSNDAPSNDAPSALLELLGGAYQTAYEKRAELTVTLTFSCAEGRRRVLEMQGEGILRRADSPIMRALLKYADVGFEVLGKKALNECCRLTVEGQA